MKNQVIMCPDVIEALEIQYLENKINCNFNSIHSKSIIFQICLLECSLSLKVQNNTCKSEIYKVSEILLWIQNW